MLVVSRFDVPDADASAFEPAARAALLALCARPGSVRGRLGRTVDEPTVWALVTEWDTVGSYRRALSAYDVKLATAHVLKWSVPEPSAYDVLAAVDDAQPAQAAPSARAR